MNFLNLNRFSHHLQVSFKDLVIICCHWYRLYAPAKFSNRRNLKQAKISDSLLLALLIWQAKSGIESQRRFWEVFDCQPIRNYRARIFRGYANIDYKATKKVYYYGFKVHAIVSDDGYILDYAVTKASVHDAKETVELMRNAHPANRCLLGDEGDLGKEPHQQLKQMRYELWTPYRKNMAGAKEHNDHQLMAIRRTIESDFSLLTYYNAENNQARSLIGFQSRLEIAILTYNLAYCLERFN